MEDLDFDIASNSTQDILNRKRLLENEIKIMKSEFQRLSHERNTMNEKIKDNADKIENNKVLPYLVGNVVELLDMEGEVAEEGANVDVEASRVGKSAVIKTSTRQTVFLPLVGLVDPETLKPGDLIGVNKDSFLILDTLPAEYDSRVKAMEVDEKPKETYADIGGLDKQVEELVEAVVLPLKQAEKFKQLGIKPPKGALMYGPPGTGKTLLARACAAQSNATFLKLAAPQLVQMFIGDGAKLVRDAFALAKEKAPTIIFIDELDAIGTKRFDSDKSGDREVQRTMLELLNQLDGFGSDDRVKVLAATNRVDVLDPALLRSGRLDRKIEFPLPSESARADILQIHSRKMTCDDSINWMELARSTDEFNGADFSASERSACLEEARGAPRPPEQMCNGDDCTPRCVPEASLHSILDSNRRWASAQVEKQPNFFSKLVDSQTPEWLWIGCSDSRVPANELLGLGPGEVFVQRNVGNLATHKDMNVMSCMEYAVTVLKVKHIIVCGHYGCGAVKGALTLPCKTPGLVNLWIQDIRDTRDKNIEILRKLRGPEQIDKLVELNVMRQVFNVCTSPIVQQAWDNGQTLAVHGLVYALSDGILQQLTPPITSLGDFEVFSHENELDGLRHLSLSVLEHMSFEREALRRTSMDPHSSRSKPLATDHEPNGDATSEAPQAAAVDGS